LCSAPPMDAEPRNIPPSTTSSRLKLKSFALQAEEEEKARKKALRKAKKLAKLKAKENR